MVNYVNVLDVDASDFDVISLTETWRFLTLKLLMVFKYSISERVVLRISIVYMDNLGIVLLKLGCGDGRCFTA